MLFLIFAPALFLAATIEFLILTGNPVPSELSLLGTAKARLDAEDATDREASSGDSW